MDIISVYRVLCEEYDIPFQHDRSVLPHDDTTLFCPAGMQQFKSRFRNEDYKGVTVANVQSCIRLNDIDLLGDGTHLAYFNMIGLFSFRHWSVRNAVDFFMEFIDRLGIKLSKVTIHPDKPNWRNYYKTYQEQFGFEIEFDNECTWSDGEMGGYCTEFYVGDVEIGNIVNPLGTCIDVGFGLERLEQLVNGLTRDRNMALIEACQAMLASDVRPGNTGRGYILRRIISELVEKKLTINNLVFEDEAKRVERQIATWKTWYENLKDSGELLDPKKCFDLRTEKGCPEFYIEKVCSDFKEYRRLFEEHRQISKQ